MPYIADPDEGTVRSVGLRLLAVALRPAETGEDAFVRIPRTKLHELIAPDIRREDFIESVRRLTEETEAVREATGTGRRADVILDRVVDEVGEWEPLLYDDFDDDIEPEDVSALLTDVHGFDVSTPLADDLLIRRKKRKAVQHDPDVPRTCARCGETKPTAEFNRRSADEADRDYHRFQSRCTVCARESAREFRQINPGYDQRDRPERRMRADSYIGFGGPVEPTSY